MIRIKLIAFIIIILTSDFTSAKSPFIYNIKWADSEAPLNTVYLHVSTQYGRVFNSDKQPLENGIGGNVSVLIPDDWLNNRKRNYFTLGIKGMNNPHPDKPYLSTMNIHGDKEIDDSFNYFQFLAGYRISRRIRDDGTYFEPRIGYILWDFHDNDFGNQAIVFSPSFGYFYRNWDFAVFSDLGFSQRRTNIGENVFFTAGISFGYNFGLYLKNKCRCLPYNYY